MKTLIIVIIIIFSCALLFQDDILQEIKLKWRASEKERMEAEGDYWVLWNEYSEAKKYSKLLNISINVRDVEKNQLSLCHLKKVRLHGVLVSFKIQIALF